MFSFGPQVQPIMLQPDTNALARGYAQGAAMRDDWRENALTKYMAENGQGILRGDQNALSGLASMPGGLGTAMEARGANQDESARSAQLLSRMIMDVETPEQFEAAKDFAMRSGIVDPQKVSQYTFNDVPALKRMIGGEMTGKDRFMNVPGVGLVDMSQLDEYGRPTVVHETPETFRTIDLGLGYGLVGNRGSQPAVEIPKDVRGEASEAAAGRAEGTATAEASLAAPQAAQDARETIRLIDGALSAPGFDANFGMMGAVPNRPGSPAADAWTRIQQLRGRAFLQAFESLKGSGQITEREGQAATQAMARLDQAQSPEAAREALQELRGIAQNALARAEGRMGRGTNDPGARAAPDEPVGQVGQRIMVGDQVLTATPEGWADETGRVIYGPDGQPVR